MITSHASKRFRRTITILAGDDFARQIVVNVEENLTKATPRFTDVVAYNPFTGNPADLPAASLEEAGCGAGRIGRESLLDACHERHASMTSTTDPSLP